MLAEPLLPKRTAQGVENPPTSRLATLWPRFLYLVAAGASEPIADRSLDTCSIQAYTGQQRVLTSVIDEPSRQDQLQHRHADAFLVEYFGRAACAAHDGGLFDGDQGAMAGGQFKDKFAVDGLDETHVGHRGTQRLGRSQRGLQQRAEGQDGDVAALPANHALAQRYGVQAGRYLGAT